MSIPSYFKVVQNKPVNISISICLLFAFVVRLMRTSLEYLKWGENLNTWEYSEFLINFHGGFVRRGLIGESLYMLYSFFQIPLTPFIAITCYLMFFAVVIFFVYKFYKHGYCWWILFSPLFLTFTDYIIRKDFILYALLLGCLYLLKSISPSIPKRLGACSLIVLGIFIHEAFLFFGFPIYALLMLSYSKERYLNLFLAAIPLCVFGILSVFKGTQEHVIGIVNSWNQLLSDSPLELTSDNSIGAIGWETFHTFFYHLRENTAFMRGGYGAILVPTYILLSYYMFCNFLSIFNSDSDSRTALSLLYSLLIISLIPMFTVLSCDIGRIFQYAAIATFGSFLIIPHNVILKIFPEWYIAVISNFNTHLVRFLIPSKGLLLLLLLFLGMSSSLFSLNTCWSNSIIGTVWTFIFDWIKDYFIECFAQ